MRVLLTRIAVAFFWMLHFLPLQVLARIGEAAGAILYFFGGERRHICLTNLARCLPEMPEASASRSQKRTSGRSAGACSNARFCGGRRERA